MKRETKARIELACVVLLATVLVLEIAALILGSETEGGLDAMIVATIIFVIDIIAYATMRIVDKILPWHRRRKVDARIKRQAIAAGVWDRPQCLGGRALDLKAWEACRIRRLYGESDAEFRKLVADLIEARKEGKRNA